MSQFSTWSKYHLLIPPQRSIFLENTSILCPLEINDALLLSISSFIPQPFMNSCFSHYLSTPPSIPSRNLLPTILASSSNSYQVCGHAKRRLDFCPVFTIQPSLIICVSLARNQDLSYDQKVPYALPIHFLPQHCHTCYCLAPHSLFLLKTILLCWALKFSSPFKKLSLFLKALPNA